MCAKIAIAIKKPNVYKRQCLIFFAILIFLIDIPNTYAFSTTYITKDLIPKDIANLKNGSIVAEDTLILYTSSSDVGVKYPITIRVNVYGMYLPHDIALQPPHCISAIKGVERLFPKEDGTYFTCPKNTYNPSGVFNLKTLSGRVSVMEIPLIKWGVFDKNQLVTGNLADSDIVVKVIISDANNKQLFTDNAAIGHRAIYFFKTNGGIYFPDFLNQSSPQIPLRIIPFNVSNSETFAKGDAKLRMCLDDANNINSKEFQLTFTDGSDPTQDQFYLKNTTSKGSTDSNVIPYQIWVKNPINQVDEQAKPRQVITWGNITKKTVLPSQVMVNGKAIPCVPAPLTFKVLPFKLSTKSNGNYTSSVDVLFTPTLNN
jgi:hypothetical protein